MVNKGQRRPWAISFHFDSWFPFVVVLKASIHRQLMWISIYNLTKSWPRILKSTISFQQNTIQVCNDSQQDSSVYAFCGFFFGGGLKNCEPLSPFVARRKKKSSLQAKYIQIAMSFNKLKHPEVILDFEISMLTRPLCKLKVTIFLNTLLKC